MKNNLRSKKIISFAVCFVMIFSFCIGLDLSVKAIETGGIKNGKVYRLKNFGSGKYLNVYGGYDANGQNVIQWTKDGSVEQNFKIVYNESVGCYKLYAMCSSSGTNRVVDVARSGGSLVSGCNVDIWTPDDNDAQFWWIVYVGNGKYRIVLNYNTACALTAYDDSNGTSSGKSSTSPGNVFISTYYASDYQHWILEEVNPQRTINDGVYAIKNHKSDMYLDVASSGGSGANVSQWDLHGNTNQRWKVTYLNNGYYVIRPVHNDLLALNVSNNYDSNNSRINVYTAPASNDPASIPYSEQWKIIMNYNGTYRIASRCSYNDKVLAVEGASTSSGANVIQYKYNATQNDEWVFEKVDIINANTIYSSSLSAGETEIFIFTAPFTGLYAIETFGNTDTYGTVISTYGTYSNDDDGNGSNCSIGFFQTAGQRAVIKIRHYNSISGTGSYTLQVRQQRAQIYTFDYAVTEPLINTHPDAATPLNWLYSMGYNNYHWQDQGSAHVFQSDSTGFTRLNSEVVFFSGHGAPSSIFFELNKTTTQELWDTAFGNMSNTKVAVWAACNSATDVDGDGGPRLSIADRSIERGAQSAIGWTKTTSVAASKKWTDQFFLELGNGMTVNGAAASAGQVFLWPWDGSYSGWVIRGDENTTVASPSVHPKSVIASPTVEKNDFYRDLSLYTYVSYPLKGLGTRYYKTINGLLTNDYYDVTEDGNKIVRSKNTISESDIITAQQQKLINPTYQTSKTLSAYSESFNKIVKSDQYDVYMKIRGQMTPIRIIYTDYTNDQGVMYQDVKCINLLDNNFIDYENICADE